VKFSATPLQDAWLIDIEPTSDERGFFARSWCRSEFTAHGLNPEIAQESISFNPHVGTLRGLHFQRAPYEEIKIVRCTRGGIFDVIVDLRPQSPTFGDAYGCELTAENRRALYIPKGFAHGFQSVTNNAEVLYRISDFYQPEAGAGYRYDDPAFGIAWPLPVVNISERDLRWPSF
jgi:dTDP-4-dehydrorhamnose 3,5-epimerase